MSDLRDDTIADLKAQLLGATASNEGLRAALKEERDAGAARVAGYEACRSGLLARDANPHLNVSEFMYQHDAWDVGWRLAAGERALVNLAACTALLEERTRELEEARARDAALAIQETGERVVMINNYNAVRRERDEARIRADGDRVAMNAALARAAALESENAGLRERVTVLEGALRGTCEYAELVGSQTDDVHVSVMAVARAVLSDAPPAGTVEGLGQSSYAVPTVDCAGCAKVACHPGEGLVCVLHYAPPASKAKP